VEELTNMDMHKEMPAAQTGEKGNCAETQTEEKRNVEIHTQEEIDYAEAEHDHDHMHTHHHQNTKAVINRLSRAIGHLTMVKKMVEEGRDCSEVLIQLAAVKSALNSTGKVILKDHLEHCMVDAIESGDMKEIEALNQAIDQFIK